MYSDSSTPSLQLKRTLDAPIEKVFAAWTNPELLARWFGPEGFVVTDVTCDLQVGGNYSITIQNPQGHTITHFGEYVEVSHPFRLVFTWILKNQECTGSRLHKGNTLVTITLVADQNKTKLTLTHEKLPDQQAFDGHDYGWQSSLEKLNNLLNMGNTNGKHTT